jgi:glycosyltransferase involved in cell wall biosynthesis
MSLKYTPQLISVIMPVYNAMPYLSESVESILKQTYAHFEFIIIDDHSTDGSYELLEKYAKKDKRISLYRNAKNLGVSHAVMKGIKHATGQYIARMDADDISSADRFTKQVAYFEKHEKSVAVGAQCYIINEHGKVTGKKIFPTTFDDVYRYSFTFVPVQQPTLMIDRSRLPKNFKFYIDGMNTAEEVELFFKLFKYGHVENIPNYLLKYRIHSTNTSFRNLRETFLLTLVSRINAIYAHNYSPTAKDVFVNLIQLAIVCLFPEKFVLWMYRAIRRINTEGEKPSFFLSFIHPHPLRHALK